MPASLPQWPEVLAGFLAAGFGGSATGAGAAATGSAAGAGGGSTGADSGAGAGSDGCGAAVASPIVSSSADQWSFLGVSAMP